MLSRLRSTNFLVKRFLSERPGVSKSQSCKTGKTNANATVSGLSTKCVKPVTGPVGPGAAPDATYKVPEYFCFNRFSYSEAEVEMAKYRCAQPSATKK